MLLLDELEEGGHVRSAEMVDGLQAGEHAAAVETLEVVLANVLKQNKKTADFLIGDFKMLKISKV